MKTTNIMNSIGTIGTIGTIGAKFLAPIVFLTVLLFMVPASMAGTSEVSMDKSKTGSLSSTGSNSKLLPPPISYQGILPKAFEMKRPWELINPFASKSYGYGRGLVSWNAKEAKPKGFIVFGVNFW